MKDPEFEDLIANEVPQLQDFARAMFYEDHEPSMTLKGVPRADFYRVVQLVSAFTEKRGIHVRNFENAGENPLNVQSILMDGVDHGRDVEVSRPTYPDERFESELRSFLQSAWPDAAYKPELEDAARTAFYEDYRPRLGWHNVHMPAGEIGKVFEFVMERLEDRGFSRA
jgi:hypothetical protein